MISLLINQCICYLLAADNIALAQPNYTKAVDGDLKTCQSVTMACSFEPPSFRIDLQHVRPVALVHVLSEVNITDVAVIVGE